MRAAFLSVSVVAMALAGPAFAASYECTVESPVALHRDGDSAKLNRITVGHSESETWKFSVEIQTPKRKSDLPTAKVNWPSDPIQIAGSFPFVPTSDVSGTFVAVSGGPCLFTEQACVTLVQIVDQANGTAKIEILPSAIAGNEKSGRDPFVAIMEGSCTKGASR